MKNKFSWSIAFMCIILIQHQVFSQENNQPPTPNPNPEPTPTPTPNPIPTPIPGENTPN
jgi:hypothetical protein